MDNLNENTQSFFRNFVNAFEAQWRARGANEHSTRIPSAGSQNRTAEDYAYVPALKQFGAFMEELGVEAGGVSHSSQSVLSRLCANVLLEAELLHRGG